MVCLTVALAISVTLLKGGEQAPTVAAPVGAEETRGVLIVRTTTTTAGRPEERIPRQRVAGAVGPSATNPLPVEAAMKGGHPTPATADGVLTGMEAWTETTLL
jgi:hypothetical protein